MRSQLFDWPLLPRMSARVTGVTPQSPNTERGSLKRCPVASSHCRFNWLKLSLGSVVSGVHVRAVAWLYLPLTSIPPPPRVVFGIVCFERMKNTFTSSIGVSSLMDILHSDYLRDLTLYRLWTQIKDKIPHHSSYRESACQIIYLHKLNFSGEAKNALCPFSKKCSLVNLFRGFGVIKLLIMFTVHLRCLAVLFFCKCDLNYLNYYSDLGDGWHFSGVQVLVFLKVPFTLDSNAFNETCRMAFSISCRC